MHYFLNYGRQLTSDELESLEEDEKSVKKQYPTLDQFREQINFYEGLHDQLKNIENVKIINVRKIWIKLYYLLSVSEPLSVIKIRTGFVLT